MMAALTSAAMPSIVVAGVFAGMFVLSVFVLIIDYGVTLAERRLLVWRPAPAEGRG